MKKSITLFATFCLSLAYAQNVSEYKYVVLPKQFSDFANKGYKLEESFIKIVKSKKYIPLIENTKEWEPLFRNNPCDLVKAEVLDDSSWMKNKVIVQFKDCENKVVSEFKAGSMIKEYEEGYQDALANSLKGLPSSAPITHLDKVGNNNTTITQTASVYQEEVKKDPVKVEDRAQSNNSVNFSNGKSTYQKIVLDENQFILTESNSTVPFATFRATAKKDVYRVKLKTGENTLGYIEKGNIIIEMPKSNGEFVNETFFKQ